MSSWDIPFSNADLVVPRTMADEYYAFAGGYDYNNSIGSQAFSHNQPRSGAFYPTIAPQQLDRRSNQYQPAGAYQISASRRHGSHSSDSTTSWSSESPPSVQSRRSDYSTREPSYSYRDSRGFDIEIKSVTSKPQQRHFCQVTGCIDEKGMQSSVSRKADLKRHMDSVHGDPTINCAYKRCDRKKSNGFCRMDHYMEHLRGYHDQKDTASLKKERR